MVATAEQASAGKWETSLEVMLNKPKIVCFGRVRGQEQTPKVICH